jgi:hypothetical protein
MYPADNCGSIPRCPFNANVQGVPLNAALKRRPVMVGGFAQKVS